MRTYAAMAACPTGLRAALLLGAVVLLLGSAGCVQMEPEVLRAEPLPGYDARPMVAAQPGESHVWQPGLWKGERTMPPSSSGPGRITASRRGDEPGVPTLGPTWLPPLRTRDVSTWKHESDLIAPMMRRRDPPPGKRR